MSQRTYEGFTLEQCWGGADTFAGQPVGVVWNVAAALAEHVHKLKAENEAWNNVAAHKHSVIMDLEAENARVKAVAEAAKAYIDFTVVDRDLNEEQADCAERARAAYHEALRDAKMCACWREKEDG